MSVISVFFKKNGLETAYNNARWNNQMRAIVQEVESKDHQNIDEKSKAELATRLFFEENDTLRIANPFLFFKEEKPESRNTKKNIEELYSAFFLDMTWKPERAAYEIEVTFSHNYFTYKRMGNYLECDEVYNAFGERFRLKTLFLMGKEKEEAVIEEIKQKIEKTILETRLEDKIKEEFPQMLWNYLKRNKNKQVVPIKSKKKKRTENKIIH